MGDDTWYLRLPIADLPISDYQWPSANSFKSAIGNWQLAIK